MTAPLDGVKIVDMNAVSVTLELPGGDRSTFGYRPGHGLNVGDLVKITTNHRGVLVAMEASSPKADPPAV